MRRAFLLGTLVLALGAAVFLPSQVFAAKACACSANCGDKSCSCSATDGSCKCTCSFPLNNPSCSCS